VFEFGGSADHYFRGYRLARQLARLSGLSRAVVIANAIADANELFGDE
jgi:hypothetical protein